jgi:hypothetical protein
MSLRGEGEDINVAFTPVEMPYPLPVNAKTFDLAPIQSISPSGSGFLQTQDRGPTLWVAKYSTPNLVPGTRLDTWRAFLDSLEGSRGVFLAVDPRRPMPKAYMDIGTIVGSEPWIAAGQTAVRVVAASYTGSTLNLDRLQAGAVITKGDYIAYQNGPAWYLHRSGATMAASGGGTITGLTVKPRPKDSSTAVAARLTRACAAMKMLNNPLEDDRLENGGPSFQLSAAQFIDRSS